MPTIHIHVPDIDDVGDLINYLYMRFGDTTFRITADDQLATQVATEPWYQQPYPSGNDYDWAIQRAEERLARFRADEEDYERVISLDCPFCGAVAGKGCHTATGALKPRPSTHAARKAALAEFETTRHLNASFESNWAVGDAITLDEM